MSDIQITRRLDDELAEIMWDPESNHGYSWMDLKVQAFADRRSEYYRMYMFVIKMARRALEAGYFKVEGGERPNFDREASEEDS